MKTVPIYRPNVRGSRCRHRSGSGCARCERQTALSRRKDLQSRGDRGFRREGGYLQMTDSPEEWGQGSSDTVSGLARRSPLPESALCSLSGWIRRCTRTRDTFGRRAPGFWPRTKHALRGTILTRTDSGGETLPSGVWERAYGASLYFEPVASGTGSTPPAMDLSVAPPARVRFAKKRNCRVLAGYQEEDIARRP